MLYQLNGNKTNTLINLNRIVALAKNVHGICLTISLTDNYSIDVDYESDKELQTEIDVISRLSGNH